MSAKRQTWAAWELRASALRLAGAGFPVFTVHNESSWPKQGSSFARSMASNVRGKGATAATAEGDKVIRCECRGPSKLNHVATGGCFNCFGVCEADDNSSNTTSWDVHARL
jgi:hypothetical protein